MPQRLFAVNTLLQNNNNCLQFSFQNIRDNEGNQYTSTRYCRKQPSMPYYSVLFILSVIEKPKKKTSMCFKINSMIYTLPRTSFINYKAKKRRVLALKQFICKQI